MREPAVDPVVRLAASSRDHVEAVLRRLSMGSRPMLVRGGELRITREFRARRLGGAWVAEGRLVGLRPLPRRGVRVDVDVAMWVDGLAEVTIVPHSPSGSTWSQSREQRYYDVATGAAAALAGALEEVPSAVRAA